VTVYSLTEIKNGPCSTTNTKRTECLVINDDNDGIIPSWNYRTVLLVDDQIDVLLAIKSMLQACGYSVDAFNDPLMAAEHFTRYPHEYGIIISDMMMPFMSGLEFMRQLRIVNPEVVTFVITTAAAIKDINKDMIYDPTLIELDGLIQKPILPDDLCRIVRRGKNRVG
jgi:CheY-like chemotaxis protein